MQVHGGQYNRPFVKPVDVFMVRGLGDLPAPVANVISIPTGHTVYFESSVNLEDNQIDFASGATVSGYGLSSNDITGTHATSLFHFNGNALVENVQLANSVGEAITIDGAAGNITLNDIGVNFCDIVVSDFQTLIFKTVALIGGSLKFTQTPTLGAAQFTCNNGVFVQISPINSIEIETGVIIPVVLIGDASNFITASGGVGFSMTDDDDQVSDGRIIGSSFSGAGTMYNNFDQTSDKWTMFDNIGLIDSCDNGIANFADTSGQTVTINTVDVWENIADAGANIT